MGEQKQFDFKNRNPTLTPSAQAPSIPSQRGTGRNAPVASWRAGGINVSIWQNENLNAEGQVQSYRTVSFERRYKDKNGDWKSTNNLSTQDLPKAILLLQQAYEHLLIGGDDDE